MSLGQKIKKLRTEKGLTQKELADKVFVTFQTVSKWEKDENEPDVSTLRELAKLFGCTMDYLLSEEEVVTPKVEEKPVVPVTPIQQVTKTVIVHQKELHACEKCKKDIPENELAMEEVSYRVGRTHQVRMAYYHKDCLEQLNKERAIKSEKERKAKVKKAKIRSFGWGIPVGVVVLVLSMIALLMNGQYHPGISVLVSILLGYATFATLYCILSGSFIEELFLSIASWSIQLPGVIFTFDIEGLIFLIAVKILFVILGFFLGIFVILLAFVISAVMSVVCFPFILAHNINTDYANATIGM